MYVGGFFKSVCGGYLQQELILNKGTSTLLLLFGPKFRPDLLISILHRRLCGVPRLGLVTIPVAPALLDDAEGRRVVDARVVVAAVGRRVGGPGPRHRLGERRRRGGARARGHERSVQLARDKVVLERLQVPVDAVEHGRHELDDLFDVLRVATFCEPINHES